MTIFSVMKSSNNVHFSLNECFLRYIGIVKCLKMLIRTNQRYKDVCKTTKPTTDFNSSVFKLIDDSIIDIKKAKARLYYDALLDKKFEEPIALPKNGAVKWIRQYPI